MSPQPAVDPATDKPQKTAMERLAEIRRSLQRLLRRMATGFEQQALDHCALLMVRAEMALRDPKSDSNDLVRLSNAARRAQADFERVCGISSTKRRKQSRGIRAVEREALAHVR